LAVELLRRLGADPELVRTLLARRVEQAEKYVSDTDVPLAAGSSLIGRV